MSGTPKSTNESYSARYLRRSAAATAAVDLSAVDALVRAVAPLRESGGTVWTVGNGGNGSLASHLAIGLSLNTVREGRRPIRALNLCADPTTLTAASNDFGFEQAVGRHLGIQARPGDVLVALSVSGESPNIVGAGRTAKGLGLILLALVGDTSSSLARMADCVVSLTTTEPGVAEDVASAVVHAIYCHFMYGDEPG